MRKLLAPVLALSILLPSAPAFALEGIGPRVTVQGIVQEVHITDKQKFDQEGGEFIIKATNGQVVTVELTTEKDYEIISEGRLSRKYLLPSDVTVGMNVRVRGWRVNSNTITASLFIVTNIELNPVLSVGGTLQSVGDNTITVLLDNGTTKTYEVTNDTQVQVSYDLTGRSALDITNKAVSLTLNPYNNNQVRIVRITGSVAAKQTAKPTTVELQRR